MDATFCALNPLSYGFGRKMLATLKTTLIITFRYSPPLHVSNNSLTLNSHTLELLKRLSSMPFIYPNHNVFRVLMSLTYFATLPSDSLFISSPRCNECLRPSLR